MVNIFQRYILVFLSKAKRALFKPFQLRALSLSLSLSLFGRATGAKFKSCRGYFNKNRNTLRGQIIDYFHKNKAEKNNAANIVIFLTIYLSIYK